MKEMSTAEGMAKPRRLGSPAESRESGTNEEPYYSSWIVAIEKTWLYLKIGDCYHRADSIAICVSNRSKLLPSPSDPPAWHAEFKLSAIAAWGPGSALCLQTQISC